MIKVPIICYHGSPGLPEEFTPLRKSLHAIADIPAIAVSRHGYPSAPQTQSRPGMDADAHRLILGYSWGALAALRDATTDASVLGVIIVAPYIKPSSSLGFLKKTLIRTPGIGHSLLSRAGRKIIDEMLEKSCSPNAVPASFWALAERMADPDVLRVAALEKEAAGPSPEDCLRQLAAAKKGVAVIWGSEDKSAKENEQITPFRQAMGQALIERRIAGAGHAIPWTHTRELAEFVASVYPRLTQ